MGINRVTILDNEPYLRQISKEVDFSDKSYLDDIKKLEEYCRANVVWAMAAVQIEIPKRIIYLRNTTEDTTKNEDSKYDEAKVLINPVILERKGHTKFLEACASCRVDEDVLYVGVVDRPYMCIVEYYDINGQRKRETFKGFETTVLSHEYDHLNGILHMDLIEEVMTMNFEERTKYRKNHPYEVISENCDYEELEN